MQALRVQCLTNHLYWLNLEVSVSNSLDLTGWRKSQDAPRSGESPRAAAAGPLLQSVLTASNTGRVISLDSNDRRW